MLRSGGKNGVPSETMDTLNRKESNNNLGRMLNDFRKEGKYVDVTIKLDDGQKFPCHKAILASSSSYFDSLFSNGWKESEENEIHLKQVSSKTFGVALEFYYTGTSKFDYDNFVNLLLFANEYLLNDLQESLLYHLKDEKKIFYREGQIFQ